MIFGLVGFAGSGKGTVGDILHDNYGFKRDSFAASVKDAVSAIFGWDRTLLEGNTHESRTYRESVDPWWDERIPGITPRKALQLMGTEAGRNVFHSDLWLYSLESRIKKDRDYVITDVRFPNEIKFLHNLGGRIIRVKRGPEPLWYDTALMLNTTSWCGGEQPQVMGQYPGIHYSEWAWIGNLPVDSYEISNEGSLENLHYEVSRMIDRGSSSTNITLNWSVEK